MRIDILSLFPQMFEAFLGNSIMKIAQENEIINLNIHNIRDYSKNKHKKVDDYAFGGGAGMVMTIQPIADAIEALKSERQYDEIIYMTPDGETFNQKAANTLSLKQNIIILCGHYKGIDQRIRDIYVTKEISIGDYVLTGGELAASVVVDAITRLIPDAMGDETSALTDSFQDNLLAPPIYTRPADYMGHKVPDVLLSGNQKLIEEWREQKAYESTKLRRPDLL